MVGDVVMMVLSVTTNLGLLPAQESMLAFRLLSYLGFCGFVALLEAHPSGLVLRELVKSGKTR
jgi:hypothetical protein